MEQSRNAALTLLVNFIRVALRGDIPPAVADPQACERVVDALVRAPVFLAEAVHDWDDSERRALFELVTAAIVALRQPAALDACVLDASTPAAVGRRFARWIVAKRGAVGPSGRPHPAPGFALVR